MRDAVKMIAGKTKKIRHPIKRHQGKSPVSTDSVQINQDKHQGISQIGKANFLEIQNTKHPDQYPNRQILHKPSRPINRVKREDHKLHQIHPQEPKEKF